MKTKISSADLFAKAKVGLGATYHSGSDSYGFYIASVDPKTKTIGIYEPRHWFKNDWTDGYMEHEPFDPTHQPTNYLQAFRGHWYEFDKSTGARLGRFELFIGVCQFYQDPSF